MRSNRDRGKYYRRCIYYENDISAEKASEIKGTRFQKKNVNSLRQKDFSNEKEKRQKVFDCISFVIPGKKCLAFCLF